MHVIILMHELFEKNSGLFRFSECQFIYNIMNTK